MASSIGHYLSLCFIFIFILLGGGTNTWSQALCLVTTGIFLICFPPRKSPGKYINIAALGLIATALLGFLPIPLFLRPRWWIEATQDFGLNLPFTLSSQPLHTLEAVVLLITVIAWFYTLSGMELFHTRRKTLLWCFSLGIFILAIGIVIGTHKNLNYPFGREAHSFSYFPNRNQTSILLAMGGVVAFTLSMIAMSSRRYIQVLCGLFITIVILFALIYSLSKAGILLFFIGCIIWLFSTQQKRSMIRYARFAVPVIIILVSVFMIYGGWTLERVVQLFDQGVINEKGFRWRIYQDTARLIADQPVLGIGLGNFEAVFPQYRENSATFHAIIHPESDWFWVWAELGTLGIVFLLFVCGAMFAGIFPFSSGKQTHYRAVAATAMIIFLAHTVVDVSAHRLGTVFAAIYLSVLARPRYSASDDLFPPLYFWRWSGVSILLVGLIWGLAWALPQAWNSSVAQKINEDRIEQALERRDKNLFEEAVNDSLMWSPLSMRPYFDRARGLIHFRENAQAARKDFRRARYLEPITADVAFYEGLAWIPHNQAYTLSAWREALARKTEFPRDLYRMMLRHSNKIDPLKAQVRALSVVDPAHQFLMLNSLYGNEFKEEFHFVAENNPLLENYSLQQKKILFKKWIDSGDVIGVAEYFDEYPALADELWVSKARADAAGGDYLSACTTVFQHLSKPDLPAIGEDIPVFQLERLYIANQHDPVYGAALLKHQIELRDWNRVLRTIGKFKNQPDIPSYVYYWEAKIYFDQEKLAESWSSLAIYLKRGEQ